ncbi:unnamed protein product [Rodentolepis nana]|uniref:Rap-GAP domain-containing protein n=1 Tax=Rodentolepis nana TaxID=102285 RepID=A0A0R3TZG4_RODNA|nr:unnamed protein product [Rodentolepis nana]
MECLGENLPLPSGMPFSKRVNEAAEHFLSILFSAAGSFPQSTGPETASCCLNEELLGQLIKSKLSPFQHFVASSHPYSNGLGSFTPDTIISLSEVVGWPTSQVASFPANDRVSSVVQLRSLAEPAPVYTFLRDNSGRHLWSWTLKYEPKNAANADKNKQGSGSYNTETLKPKDKRHFVSCLDNDWPKKLTSEANDPFMPRTVDNIPLVRAVLSGPSEMMSNMSLVDEVIRLLWMLSVRCNALVSLPVPTALQSQEEKEMPTLAQSVMNSRARQEVDILKSLINSETDRTNSLRRRIRDTRVKDWSSAFPTEGLCKPDQRADRLSSSHLLSCHLGYVPVNSLQPFSNSFRTSNDSPPSTSTQSTTRRPAPSIDGRRIPGTKGVGGAVESVSLIPSALTPLDASLIRNIDSHLVAGQRSTASLFVFYVKDGQTSFTDVIDNMNAWSDISKDFVSFVCSMGWQVDVKHHPGWRGPLRGVPTPTLTATSHFSGFDARRKFPSTAEFIRSAPDGVENVFYWADASTEVVTLCPSKHTMVEKSILIESV